MITMTIEEFYDRMNQTKTNTARSVLNECRTLLSRLLNGEIKCHEFNMEFAELMKKYGVEDDIK